MGCQRDGHTAPIGPASTPTMHVLLPSHQPQSSSCVQRPQALRVAQWAVRWSSGHEEATGIQPEAHGGPAEPAGIHDMLDEHQPHP